ncbi:MAG: TonB-dependent receptor, partial [Victivallales bacterium]|nr:TonB-dependent receptor [Victivallales bacterium]
YTIIADPLGTRPLNVSSDKESDGWNILGRWTRDFSADSQMQLQMYIDWNAQEYLNPAILFTDKRRVSEIDFQHNLKIGGGHNVVWGATYRRNRLTVRSNISTFLPDSESKNSDVLSGFIQDSFPFFSRELEMTLGSKVERNDFTGGETQPCVRLTWKPNDSNVVWAAVSKAVKVPGYETEAQLTVGGADVPAGSFGVGNPPIDLWMPFNLIGNPLVSEEEVIAYELGYRVKPNDKLSMDITVFTNRGHHMQRTASVSSFPYVVQLVSTGVIHYEGIELSTNWIISDQWRLVGGYTWFDAQEKSTVPIAVGDETPKNQAQLRSYLDIGDKFEINAAVYYKDNINHEDSRI